LNKVEVDLVKVDVKLFTVDRVLSQCYRFLKICVS